MRCLWGDVAKRVGAERRKRLGPLDEVEGVHVHVPQPRNQIAAPSVDYGRTVRHSNFVYRPHSRDAFALYENRLIGAQRPIVDMHDGHWSNGEAPLRRSRTDGHDREEGHSDYDARSSATELMASSSIPQM